MNQTWWSAVSVLIYHTYGKIQYLLATILTLFACCIMFFSVFNYFACVTCVLYKCRYYSLNINIVVSLPFLLMCCEMQWQIVMRTKESFNLDWWMMLQNVLWVDDTQYIRQYKIIQYITWACTSTLIIQYVKFTNLETNSYDLLQILLSPMLLHIVIYIYKCICTYCTYCTVRSFVFCIRAGTDPVVYYPDIHSQ